MIIYSVKMSVFHANSLSCVSSISLGPDSEVCGALSSMVTDARVISIPLGPESEVCEALSSMVADVHYRNSDIALKKAGEFSWNYLPKLQIRLNTHLIEFKEHILLLIRLCSHWDPSRLASTMLKGGVTNSLFAIHDSDKGLNDSGENVVLLRMNGTGTEDIINRTDEIISMLTLHKHGLSSPVYAQLKNGLCYGFMPGSPLSMTDIKDESMIKRIVRAIAKLHSLEIPVDFCGRKPQVWHKLEKWLCITPRMFDDPVQQKCFSETIGSIESLEGEFKEIKGILSKSRSPVVFCHNDLTNQNLIYNKDKGTIGIIDLEYAGPNFLAYDIANCFCEYGGVENVDYDNYPTEKLQKFWLRNYLEEAALLKGGQSSSVTQADVKELYRDVNKFALSCHLFWTVWSLFQAHNSTLKFNYLEYAGHRFAEYRRRKHDFLAL